MRITIQEKIAELESRIDKLEKERLKPSASTTPPTGKKPEAAATSKTTTTTTTTSTSPLTPEQDSHLAKMWGKFDEMFDEFRKIFR